ncbi:HAMP domain-containing sensor histidine kinase [Isoptericola halotolerans]|uniref:sensor histidine kinase n=1 Tax=Isoptericola halotolerans TaxID=300560 RepID=UPI00388ED605
MRRVSLRVRTAITFAVASAAITATALVAVAAVTQSPLMIQLVADGSQDTGSAPPAFPSMSGAGATTGGPAGATGDPPPADLVENIAEQFAARQWTVSAAAVGIAALLAGAVGWAAAGAALRPLNQMMRRAETIDADTLDARIGLDGPNDELTRLALAFDELLGRLEESFAAQVRFVAFASHELRTPLAVQRALLEIGLDDPSPEDRERVRDQLLEQNRHNETMVSGLLSLAQSQGAALESSEFDLSDVVREELDAAAPAIAAASLRLNQRLAPLIVTGDAALARTLIRNLIHNGVAHNRRGGLLQVEALVGERALEIANDGDPVPLDAVERILQPFERVADAPSNEEDHHGLGLTIISTIARRHGWKVILDPRDAGGLTTRLQLQNGQHRRDVRPAP